MMTTQLCSSAALLLSLGLVVEGARILGVFPFPAKSHHVIHQAVLMTLADAGHQLVVYSLFPPRQEHVNYTHVQLYLNLTAVDMGKMVYDLMNVPGWQCPLPIDVTTDRMIKSVFENNNLAERLRSKPEFDLVITEALCWQEHTSMLGSILGVPTIAIEASHTTPIVNDRMGNDHSLSFVPHLQLPYADQMSLTARIHSALCTLKMLYVHYWVSIPHFENTLKTHFPEAPPISDLLKNVSLVFVNDHMLVDYARPRTPNVVSVAGIHVGHRQQQQLDKDVQEFLDTAQEGVILFSLGSTLPEEYLPDSYFDACINVFKSIPQKVLWKTRMTSLKNLPRNVKISDWLSQEDVLAHPNCVLFVTHGGLLSQHEAIHYGVPVVGIPYFYDQHRNVAFYVAKGVGVRLLPSDLTEDTLRAAITTVINHLKYKENMKRLSQVFRDRPMSPTESVVYWTEYVSRHGGAPHLTPASVRLSWYQLWMLDVAAVVLTVLTCIVVLLYYIGRKCITLLVLKYKSQKSDQFKKIK